MKISFLGAGGAFSMKSWHTNLLITEGDKNLLIDAGGDIRFSLAERMMNYQDIDAVFETFLLWATEKGLVIAFLWNTFDLFAIVHRWIYHSYT